MKTRSGLFFVMLSLMVFQSKAQTNDEYIEFDDRKNIVHGVYLGLNFLYGEMDGESAYMAGAKVAYVANQKFEVGFAGVGFYSEQKSNNLLGIQDLYGAYGGLHVEPIFFGDSMFNLSFPILIGGGAVSYSNNDFQHWNYETWEPVFVVEPGASLLYNVSSYLQFEVGVKYRFSSQFDLYPGSIDNLNGFSAGIGLKVGVFNLGKKG